MKKKIDQSLNTIDECLEVHVLDAGYRSGFDKTLYLLCPRFQRNRSGRCRIAGIYVFVKSFTVMPTFSEEIDLANTR